MVQKCIANRKYLPEKKIARITKDSRPFRYYSPMGWIPAPANEAQHVTRTAPPGKHIITSMPAADQPQGGDPRNLIRALREHRDVEENFRRLFQLYYSAVFSYFSRKGFPPEDCRDLTQEVFVGVYTGLDRLRADDAFTAWLFTIDRKS